MARYDDEENWLPRSLVEPLMWLVCLIAAALPTLLLAGLWSMTGWHGPKGLFLGAYIAVFTGLVALTKPWTHR